MSLKLTPRGVPASEQLPPSPFERGRLLEWDDFESASLKYYPAVTGAGTIGRSITNPMFGDFSLKMVTGATINNYCKTHYATADFLTGRIRAQIGFATQPTIASNAIVYIYMFYYTGSIKYQGALQYETVNNQLSYYGDDDATHLIDTITYNTGVAAPQIMPYNTMGIELDLANETYSKALFLGREFDLTSHNLYEVSLSSEYRGLLTYIQLMTKTTAAQTVYFDRFRLTEDEPA